MSDTDGTRGTDSENEYQARKRARVVLEQAPAPSIIAAADTVWTQQGASTTWDTNQPGDRTPKSTVYVGEPPEAKSVGLPVSNRKIERNMRIRSRWTELIVIKEELESVRSKAVSAMDRVEKMIDDECREWLNLS